MDLALTFNLIAYIIILSGLYLVYTIQTSTKKDIKFPNKYIIPKIKRYNWPNDKKSGVGGSLVMGNPLPLDVPSELTDGIFNSDVR
jgi:hypothetical protein